jgi:uracil-DNA glycosylase
VENVTDRTSNPFGMRPPCPHGPESAVPGYGDANADFHLIGDHPGVHGGGSTGVPFTGSLAGERLQAALSEAGFLEEPYSDEPAVWNLFLSYLHMCRPSGDEPTEAEYADLERFFDAELRAIAAHVLLPVGERAIRHVVGQYTAKVATDVDVEGVHATEIRGSGFLVVPIADPAGWGEGDHDALVDRLCTVLAMDYRQTTDLSRFLGTSDLYFVR